MTQADIEQKMQAASDEFDQLEQQRQNIVTRQQQLQGSYQTLEGLLKDTTDPATTVVAKEAKVGAKVK